MCGFRGGGGVVCVKKEIFTEMHENLLHSILKHRPISCVLQAASGLGIRLKIN